MIDFVIIIILLVEDLGGKRRANAKTKVRNFIISFYLRDHFVVIAQKNAMTLTEVIMEDVSWIKERIINSNVNVPKRPIIIVQAATRIIIT